MQPVPAPPLVVPSARWVAASAIAVLVALALLAVAVAPVREGAVSGARGGEESTSPVRTSVALIGGVKLQSARCAKWVAGSAAEKAGVVGVLKNVVGGPTPYGPANALSASQAYALFDRTCANSYAGGFLLYELYTRASAFRPRP